MSSLALISTAVGTADSAPSGAAKINACITLVNSLSPSGTVTSIAPSGDASGITDTANFAAAYLAASNATVQLPGSSVRTGTITINIAQGVFYINASNMMMNATTPNHPTAGIVFKGAGQSLTSFIYTPTVSGPMFTNSWWLVVQFSGISFQGTDPNSDFWDSIRGAAAIQDFSFTDCAWSGSWNNLFSLSGGNNNSEWKFSRCSVTTSTLTGSWIYTPTVGNGGSDQFLNFWFLQCKFWSANGSWLTLNTGGQVKIYQCDVSGNNPTVNTYLFNLLGSSHAGGVCFFLADGLRIEHNSDQSLTIHSQWAGGMICFALLDESSQHGNRNIANVYAFYDHTNVAGPNIEYRQCNLLGTHTYATGTSNWQYQSKIIYRNCTILDQNSASAFITWTSTGNSGGAPGIRFEDCRTEDSYTTDTFRIFFDSDLYWNKTFGGITNVKTGQMVGTNSDWPTSNGHINFQLPLNCAITQIRFWKGTSGAGAAFQYVVQTTDTTPVVLAGGASTAMAGANATSAIALYTVTFNPPFILTGATGASNTIQVLEQIGRTGSFTNVFCLVDYIG